MKSSIKVSRGGRSITFRGGAACAAFQAMTGAQLPAVEKKAEEIRTAGCEICAGPVAWFESVCGSCVERRGH